MTSRRHLVMCRPDAFDVTYAINALMDPTVPVDRGRALAQWEALRAVYEGLGHRVDVVDALPGQPDMVFAANGGLALGARAVGARFAHPERAGEAPAFRRHLRRTTGSAARPCPVPFEGEGDAVVCASVVLLGHGFRTSAAAAAHLRGALGVPVVPLRLVDPRFYHLDTCVWHLGGDRVAWYPPALDPASQDLVRRLFPGAVEADEADALALGLNGWSDGRTAVLPRGATGLAASLVARGHEVVEVDTSELRRAGGGPKCCTGEIHPALVGAGPPAAAPLAVELVA